MSSNVKEVLVESSVCPYCGVNEPLMAGELAKCIDNGLIKNDKELLSALRESRIQIMEPGKRYGIGDKFVAVRILWDLCTGCRREYVTKIMRYTQSVKPSLGAIQVPNIQLPNMIRN